MHGFSVNKAVFFSVFSSLPKSVQRRIKALKKLQFESTKIEAEFYEEIHQLECKYAARYAPIYEKVRKALVTAVHRL